MIDDFPAPFVLGSWAGLKSNELGSLPGVVGFSDDKPESGGYSLPEVGFSDSNEPRRDESSRGKLAASGSSSDKSAAIETEKPAIKNARGCMMESELMGFE